LRSPIVLSHLHALLLLQLVHVTKDIEAVSQRADSEVDERLIVQCAEDVSGDSVF